MGRKDPSLIDRAQERIDAATARNNAQDAPRHHRIGTNGHAPDEVVLIRGDKFVPEPVKWLWQSWLAGGKFHVLAGAPGTGKTTIALAMAATISAGGRWPDGFGASAGTVIIWSGEDDPKDTLVPRLIAMGADMARVHFISNTIAQGELRPFDPARDIEILTLRAAEIGDVRLLIVDPVVSAVAGDSHKNADTRRALQPLVDLAAALGCAVLGISHYSKGTQGRDPVERVTGSLAFGALARVVWGTAKATEEGQRRRLVRAKSNIGPDGGGFEYDLEQTEVAAHPGLFASRVRWCGAIEGGARELLAETEAASDPNASSERDHAKQFLLDLLKNGPVPAKQVTADTIGAGLSIATVRRAKSELGVDAVKTGLKGGWAWQLPAKALKNSEDAQQRSVSAFGKSEHLQQFCPESLDAGEVF